MPSAWDTMIEFKPQAKNYRQLHDNGDDNNDNNDDNDKHRKNCECCPGHYLIVNQYSSMS